MNLYEGSIVATATKKSAAKPAPAAKKAAPKKTETVELTPIDDGVSIKVGDAYADLHIKGRFDLDGLISVAKRVDRARGELS